MSHLHIDIRNCYGIGTMTSDIELKDERPVAVIYAPNGTMKTSLAKAFDKLVSGKEPCDEIYTDRDSAGSITIDGAPIDKENTYLFANEDVDCQKQISTFLANDTLRSQYEAIYQQLDKAKKALTRKVKQLAQSTDCEEEILAAFRTSENDNYFDCLVLMEQQIEAGDEALEYPFKFNAMFDKEGRVRDFINENRTTIIRYFNKYQELLSHSVLYSTGSESFGTGQANTLLKSVVDNRFFRARHKFELSNGTVINSKSEMEQLMNDELETILTDADIKRLFKTLEDKLQKNTGLRDFKDIIQTYPELIPELTDYDAFQKKVLRGYLRQCQPELHALTTLYLAKRDELKDIIRRAQEDVSQWEQVIELFNSRFFVPFTLRLENKSDILLSSKAAELQFLYRDTPDSPTVKQERKTLVEHLCTGERRAFFILQNIFELEARKAKGQQTLLVFDDVADSFDYKNKYAIIEYLHDLSLSGCFKMLILTHNFDFYRTICSRLTPVCAPFAHKDENRVVTLRTGLYAPDILKRRLLGKLSERRPFIASIPFVRNLIEYTEGDSDDKYITLTACLHVKELTPSIKMADILGIFQSSIKAAETAAISFADQDYLTALSEEAEAIMADANEIDIVNKLVLSMAIRIKAEQFMKSVLTAVQIAEIRPNRNQTSELLCVLKKYHHADMLEQCLLMNRVLMLTSENIHINNFMFEPLVDISILYLKQLYTDVKNV